MIWGSKGFNIKLIPRDSKESPLYQANLTSVENFNQMVDVTNARAQWLGLMTLGNNNSRMDTVQPVVLNTKGLYCIVEMDIGTPARRFYLMLDTGTAMTWIQSADCTECFQTQGGSFDYKHSTSFKFLDCNHPMCLSRSCQQEKYCSYRAMYGGGGSYGTMVSDKLTFNSDTGKGLVEMYFGLGIWNSVNFGPDNGPDNRIAGIFGLGLGDYSFPKQAALGSFSHCLPSFEAKVSTVLKFGNNADIPSDAEGVQTTPFVQGRPGSANYYLDCSGISVDGVDIGLPPNTFKYDPVTDKGGMVIDTGAPVTGIFPSAYKYLEDALNNYFAKFSLKPWTGARLYSPYCYVKPPNFYQFPTITFHLQGAHFILEPDNGFRIEEDHFCLAIAPLNADISIIGAFAQTNHVVRYDTINKKLSWYRESCGSGPALHVGGVGSVLRPPKVIGTIVLVYLLFNMLL
ncbi:hypothetical protein AQUCO_02200251v1 [Aquilegia coerulea]|uniref:Peptidase A1 domain-containing protein n=1 Tax=Aquilegia coerulea TaxID=218851 RepID=A0A2G5DDY3_AQUCA|nr:hypothetical protein AQUCO_02200251v1 [Aquilegia coerulea]